METLSNEKPAGVLNDPPKMIDMVVRLVVIGALALVCYRAFSPFLGLMAWAIILAVTLYPLHQRIVKRVWGKQGLASVLLVVIGLVIILAPTALLLNSLADSVRGFIADVQNNTLHIPPPSAGVADWPLVGDKIFAYWSKAHTDLPGLVQSLQPKISELAGRALSAVASIGTTLLLFAASFVVASILMAYGDSGSRTSRGIFNRIAGERGEALWNLSIATIRAVALGVIGVAFIQAILVGLALFISGVPAAGVLAIIMLVLGIAQVPALIVTIPAIVYIWASGGYSTSMAIAYTVLLLVVGMADNVLKPLMLGRGVDVPMPVILLGALGGMATGGILGMFVGATALAIGYVIFMAWVGTTKEEEVPEETQTTEIAAPAAAAI
jgi:predicted PurR-regulated permease PerM